MTGKAAIYHFTDKSAHRPKIYRDQLNALKAYAASVGFDVVDVFCDMSLKRFERTEFDRFLSCSEQYDALITKDFYHISRVFARSLALLECVNRTVPLAPLALCTIASRHSNGGRSSIESMPIMGIPFHSVSPFGAQRLEFLFR